MNFRAWFENHLPTAIAGLRSKEEFLAFLKKSTPQDRQAITDWAEKINNEHYAKKVGTDKPTILYHGSPQDKIAQQGFQVTMGERSSGFMGASYSVQNQGIFMTDSKEMANFFGSNRSDGGRNYRVYTAYANLDHVFDTTAGMPLQFRKLGLQLINDYYGKKKTKLAESDIWWLLDRPQFVDLIKKAGYAAVKFKEDYAIRKQSSKTAFSYLVFDPSHLVVKSPSNDLLKDVDSIWNYISGQSSYTESMSSTVFIRFGDWHHTERSRNYATGDTEIGVSVFEAVKEGQKYRILLDEEHDPDGRQADTYWGWMKKFDQEKDWGHDPEPIYIVTGEVVGTGYDGEPLLKGLKIVGQIEHKDLGRPKL